MRYISVETGGKDYLLWRIMPVFSIIWWNEWVSRPWWKSSRPAKISKRLRIWNCNSKRQIPSKSAKQFLEPWLKFPSVKLHKVSQQHFTKTKICKTWDFHFRYKMVRIGQIGQALSRFGHPFQDWQMLPSSWSLSN